MLSDYVEKDLVEVRLNGLMLEQDAYCRGSSEEGTVDQMGEAAHRSTSVYMLPAPMRITDSSVYLVDEVENEYALYF